MKLSCPWEWFDFAALFVGSGIQLTPVASSQSAATPSDECGFAEANGLRLHYLDFGGTGLAAIFVQSFHGVAGEWATTTPRGSPAVLGQPPRAGVDPAGLEASEDTGWGYDVATQAEDLLEFMDALGLERAAFVGRDPANQDITWLAEHHRYAPLRG